MAMCSKKKPSWVISHRPNSCNGFLYFQVNQIVPLVERLGTKRSLCETLTSVSHVPSLRRSQPAPPCFPLPDRWDDYLVLADAMGTDARWVLKPGRNHQGAALEEEGGVGRGRKGSPLMLVQPTKNRDFFKMRE